MFLLITAPIVVSSPARADQYTMTELLNYYSPNWLETLTFEGTQSPTNSNDVIISTVESLTVGGVTETGSQLTLNSIIGVPQVSFNGLDNNYHLITTTVPDPNGNWMSTESDALYNASVGHPNEIYVIADVNNSKDPNPTYFNFVSGNVSTSAAELSTYTLIDNTTTTVPELAPTAMIAAGLFGFGAARTKKHKA